MKRDIEQILRDGVPASREFRYVLEDDIRTLIDEVRRQQAIIERLGYLVCKYAAGAGDDIAELIESEYLEEGDLT